MANKKQKTFIDLVIAIIKGDDAEVLAIKIQKKAVATLRAQIAVKEAHTLHLEDLVDSCQEVLNKSRINSGKLITSGEDYILSLMVAEKDLKESISVLEAHKEDIKFLEGELASVSSK